MNDKEKKIIEQRTIEATRKGLMGFSGKLGIILRSLGQPIISQADGIYMSEYFGYSSNNYDQNDEEIGTMEVLDLLGNPIEEPFDDSWTNKNSNRKNISIRNIGWHYDGLNRSMHLEIKFLEEQAELTVYYEGNLVFKEISGELKTYIPFDDWELKIESLFKASKKIDDVVKTKEKTERLEEAKKNKSKWLKKMKENWGI